VKKLSDAQGEKLKRLKTGQRFGFTNRMLISDIDDTLLGGRNALTQLMQR